MPFRPVILAVALAGCANEARTDLAATDTLLVAGVVAPRTDTLTSSVNLRCTNGTEVRANTYVGHQPRMVLATQDTGMVLLPREAASGSRYATDDESIVWWNQSDSASFTFRGTTTQCGPADDVEF